MSHLASEFGKLKANTHAINNDSIIVQTSKNNHSVLTNFTIPILLTCKPEHHQPQEYCGILHVHIELYMNWIEPCGCYDHLFKIQ